MQKVAILTDSNTCLLQEHIDKYQIKAVPALIYAKGRIYRDSVDITAPEAYEMFYQDPDNCNISQGTPEHYAEALQEVSQQASNILCITFSRKISTHYQIIETAREHIQSKLPKNTVIEIIDSRTLLAAQGFVVLAAARAASEGKELAEVVKIAQAVSEKSHLILLMDTVRYLHRSGRLPKIAKIGSQIGSFLPLIKPLFTASSGSMHFRALARNKKQGINRMLEEMRKSVTGDLVHAAIMHALVPDEAEELKQKIADEFNCVDLWITDFSPLQGFALGPGALGVGYYND